MESQKKISNQKKHDSSEAVPGTSSSGSRPSNPNNIKKEKPNRNKMQENSLNSAKNQESIGESAFSGQLYEIYILMLLIIESYAKRNNKGFSFHLGTNVKQGYDFDDVIYMSGEKDKDGKNNSHTIFIQAKHKSSMASKVTLNALFSQNKNEDFSLKKYFRSFCEVKKEFANENEHPVFSSDFSDCHFIIYTNAPLVAELDKFILRTLHPGNALYLKEHKNFYKIKFDALNENQVNVMKGALNVDDDEVKDFLAKLELRTGQPTEKNLSKIIKKMIKTADPSIEEHDVDYAFNSMSIKVEQWWKEKISEFRNERNTTFFQDSLRINIKFDVKDPVALFTGRKSELLELHQILQKKTYIFQKTCISGLGGIGKTEFTRKYINDYGRHYDGNILWINAENEKTRAESFRRLAQLRLNIKTTIDGKERNIKTIKDDVYNFFLSRSRKSLFVFDNADEINSFNKFLPVLKPYQTECAYKPLILVTSRFQDWGRVEGMEGMDVFSLGELKTEEAVQFVKKGLMVDGINVLEDDKNTNSKIEALVKKLQNYPLAIKQAIAYIDLQKETKLYEITNYIEKIEELLESKPNQGINNIYAHTTFTTWTLTVEKIKEDKDFGELAIEIFNVIAYFAPNNIKRDLFSEIGDSVPQVKEAVRLLVQYSMINDEQKQSILFIHRLVQEVTRIKLKEHCQEEKTLKSALSILCKKKMETENVDHAVSCWDFASNYGELVREFRTLPLQVVPILHDCVRFSEAYSFGVKALTSLNSFADDFLEDIYNLKQSIAGVLNSQGEYKEAHKIYTCVYDKFTSLFDLNDRRVLETRHNIAQTLQYLGKYDEAYKKFKETLDKKQHYLGDDDEDTLLTKRCIALVLTDLGNYKEALLMYADLPTGGLQDLNNYAVILDRCGDYGKAKQVYQDVLERKMKKFGEEHLSTMTTKHNLAGLLHIQGEPNQALEMYEEVLVVRKKLLNPTHRDICATEVNMAMVLDDQGRHKNALSNYEKVLSKQIASLGSYHPDSLTTMNNKGVVLEKLQRYDEALEVHQHVLDQRRLILGEEHPYTLTTRHNIAVIKEKKEQYEEALKDHTEIYNLRRKTFGENDLSTLTSQDNRASVLEKLQKYDEALNLYEDVLKKRTEQLRPNHKDLLSTRNGIALIHLRQKRYDEALSAFRETLEVQTKCLSPNHIELLVTRINIAKGLEGQKNYCDALAELEEVLNLLNTDSTEQDRDHYILITQQNMAGVIKLMGRMCEALEMLEEVFSKRSAIFGASHPDTKRALICLNDILEDGFEYEVALNSYQNILNIQTNMSEGSEPNMDALQTKNRIAKLLKSQGNYNESLQAFQEILVVLGNFSDIYHENYLQVLHNIGTVQELLGNNAEAVNIYRDVLDKRFVLLGSTNADTLTTKSCLASLLEKMK